MLNRAIIYENKTLSPLKTVGGRKGWNAKIVQAVGFVVDILYDDNLHDVKTVGHSMIQSWTAFMCARLVSPKNLYVIK